MNLEPLRLALRAETDAEVQGRLAEVDAECARVVADAEAKAHELARQGHREGEEAAAKEAVRRRATATRRAREARLQAQRRQVEELQRTSREAVLRLCEDSRYPQLLERLAREARDQLGPDTEVELDPPGLIFDVSKGRLAHHPAARQAAHHCHDRWLVTLALGPDRLDCFAGSVRAVGASRIRVDAGGAQSLKLQSALLLLVT